MNQNLSQLADAGTRVASDFRSLATHAEELLKATKTATGDSVEHARQRLTDSLTQAREHLAADTLLARGREAAIATGTYARQHPWQILAAALAVGLVFGLLSRRDSEKAG
jgi:ElaB/YqjD/DUF883 family membrane-anchored ribosome-binding protein